ncbi:MAG TPA: hypothetical protein DCO70_10450, partial [Verrucomicrobiales bacterium]|nr:hypothetical protein [Verrucomicrobiales bacterium]
MTASILCVVPSLRRQRSFLVNLLSMHRFFVPPEECQNDPIYLPKGEARHARSVLRLREGDRVIVLNGAGKELLCQVKDVRNNCTSLKLIQENTILPLPF